MDHGAHGGPLSRLAATMVAVAAAGCPSTAEPTAAAPATVVASVAGASTAEPAVPGSSAVEPAGVACRQDLLDLELGEGLFDSDDSHGIVVDSPSQHDSRRGRVVSLRRASIGAAVASLSNRGLRLIAAVRVAPQTDPTLALAIVAEDQAPPATGHRPLQRGFLRCVHGKGFQLASELVSVGPTLVYRISGVQRFGPDEAWASVVLRTQGGTPKARTELVVVGRPPASDPSAPSSPASLQIYELGDLASARHDDTLRGTGWYPLDRGYAYLQIGHRGDDVDMAIIATLDRHDLHRGAPREAWALVGGPGGLPAACAGDEALACDWIQTRYREQLSPELTWVAGLWTDRAAALKARGAVTDPSTRWVAVGQQQGAGPDGKPALKKVKRLPAMPLPAP